MKSARMLTILGVAVVLLLWPGQFAMAAEMGTAFTYQGHLYDANYPADGPYDFQFKLYDSNDPCDCNQIGADVNAGDMEVMDGYFTVALDFNDANAFNGDARWLEIGVRPGEQDDPNGYTALSPRQEVTAAPYVLHAKVAESTAAGGYAETDPTVLEGVKDGVDWSEVTSRPAGLDDGDDVGITVESDPTVLASVKDGVGWSEVTGIPADIADGDDIGLTSETDPTVAASVKDGVDWSEVTSIPGGFADGVDDVGLTSESDPTVDANVKDGVSWSELTEVPAGFADGNDDTGVSYWTESGGNVYRETGNVGIGTASPSAKLEVDGTIKTDGIYESVVYGDFWTAKESKRLWRSVAVSADGTIQTAVVYGGQIYVSTDTGNTWTAKESDRSWQSVAMSADGTKQTAVVWNMFDGRIYVSTDSGNTWTPKESDRWWQSVAMSADGTIQTAVDGLGIGSGGQIYVSTDSGNTWTAKESNRLWHGVAMSADGTIQTAVVQNGQIYVSTDSGNTWTAKESSRDWRSVAVSADGTKQTAVVFGGQIYVSTDTGNTWAAKESNRPWYAVAMSADGTKQTAVVSMGQIYVSTDSGNSWTVKESGRYWYGVAMSAEGTIQTAVVLNGQIYVSSGVAVGIGTRSLSQNFHVAGGVAISGSVGIGMASPRGILDIQGSSFMPMVILENLNTTDGHVGIQVKRGNSTAESSISFQDPNNTEVWKIGMDNAPGGTEGDFAIKTTNNAAAEFTIKSDGAVGIGTTNPMEKLEVNGTVKATALVGDGSGLTNVVETDPTVAASVKDGVDWSEVTSRPAGLDDGDDIGITVESDPTVAASVKDGVDWSEVTSRPAGLDDGDDVGITVESDPEVGAVDGNYVPRWDGSALVTGTIYDDGNVGIGTTSPAAKLQVAGDAKITGSLSAGNDSTVLFVDDANDGVGIGTTSPAAALDVNGTAKILAWHDQQVDPNGYAWVGSILFQWGSENSGSDAGQNFSFPISFPTECFSVTAGLPGTITATTSYFTLDRHNDYEGTIPFYYMAIGH